MAYKSVNKSVPRIEGADKVSGKMRYAADLDFPNALAAKILRTSLPHAKILSIDTSNAFKLRGVRAVITGALHLNFGDFQYRQGAQRFAPVLGPIAAERSTEIVHRLVREWFDQWLLGKPSRLLGGERVFEELSVGRISG
jgi:CO/xanthine dehydrogenase Mo-binding subunit